MTTETRVSPAPIRILVGEDEPEVRDYLQLALWRPNFSIDVAENGEEVLTSLFQGDTPAVVILDVRMPLKDGISTLREIRRREPDLPVIMLSGLSSKATIDEAMKSGANNFLIKPISHEDLRTAVDQVLPSASTGAKPLQFAPRLSESIRAGNWNKKLDPLLARIANSNVPVLLQGETGSGKEVLARRVHDQSPRSGQTFLKVNCAALPSELIESELFGYERGAFTGAFRNSPGKFELADHGTIFLDEIGDMAPKLQAKLLQVLQDQEFSRLGARQPTRVDVRVIAATHCDLEARIDEGAFREDLFYRLNVVNIVIPPLRDRRDEIIPLASLFLKRHGCADRQHPPIGPNLRAALLNHCWPGNVRELENTMRRYLVTEDDRVIIEELKNRVVRVKRGGTSGALAIVHSNGDGAPNGCSTPAVPEREPPQPSPVLIPPPPRAAESGFSESSKVDEARRKAETDVIVQALQSTRWHRKRAATVLGMDYKKFLYKLKRLGIDKQ